MDWYRKNIENTIEEISSDSNTGLSKEEVNIRLEKHGPNELKETEREGLMSKILYQFKDFLVLILIGASIVSILVGEVKDSIVIIAIVIINATLGIIQEGRAEKALEALKKMASPNAKVIREGQLNTVPANTLVPGDLVVLEAGDIIPADLRLIESSNLKIEEASLTGESVPVEKNASNVFDDEVPLGDRNNMAYMSTVVTYGRGKGVVVGTSGNTEIGKIAELIQTFEDETTPLQKKLDQLGKYLGIGCLVVCGIVFAVGLYQGRKLLDMFMVAISLAVAAIPEGLPAIVTIVLALGMNKMVKRNAIVKKLLAVETLGCTTVICSDKTGTLTQNEMTVVKTFTDNNIVEVTGKGYAPEGEFLLNNEPLDIEDTSGLKLLLSIGTLCNDATLDYVAEDNIYRVLGDPTEGALVTLAKKGKLSNGDLSSKYPRVNEIPFDSERKMMTTFHENYIENKVVSFTKGAPDIILKRCNSIFLNGKIQPLTEEIRKEIESTNSGFSQDALRVLAFSFRTHDALPSEISSETIENDLIFVGLVGMIDPPRTEAKDAISICKEAGINTIMITGDYKETAFAIGRDLGMADNIKNAMTGEELNKISDEELREKVKTTNVFARVAPEHKVRIVDALKYNGEITAMTGDGVNDALALKRADIGISMGITGTDVAKNTAEVILTDDNFASIVSAVEEGRIIYSNIRKFVFFLLSCNVGEILIVFLSILFNLQVPLLPIQLLWLNLITDSFPALALGVERGEPDIMNIPPRDPDEPIFDKTMLSGVIIQSLAITLAVMLAYLWGLKHFAGLTIPRTIAFTTLITAELMRAFSSRSEVHTLFKIGFFTNKTLVYATLASLGLMFAVVYIPVLQPIFHTYPLGLKEWSIVLRFCIIPLVAGELSKVIRKRA